LYEDSGDRARRARGRPQGKTAPVDMRRNGKAVAVVIDHNIGTGLPESDRGGETAGIIKVVDAETERQLGDAVHIHPT
jgi:hypothetical protein